MNTNLTVVDPLADQEVTIIITLAATEQPRDQRSALISVGVAEQLPVIKTGVFGDIAALIHETWNAFSIRAKASEAAQAVETAAEEHLLATADMDGDEPAPTPQPHLSAPKPQAKNLSLF